MRGEGILRAGSCRSAYKKGGPLGRSRARETRTDDTPFVIFLVNSSAAQGEEGASRRQINEEERRGMQGRQGGGKGMEGGKRTA